MGRPYCPHLGLYNTYQEQRLLQGGQATRYWRRKVLVQMVLMEAGTEGGDGGGEGVGEREMVKTKRRRC